MDLSIDQQHLNQQAGDCIEKISSEKIKELDKLKSVEENNINNKEDNEEDNEEDNDIDLEFNSDEWLDLLDNKDILKKILFTKQKSSDDQSIKRVNRGSKTKINLEIKNYQTQQVISSESFNNLEVIVGDHDVIHGIDLILPMMYLYEKSRIIINPRFGYGEKGRLPDVEPNTRLDCTVEILEIKDDITDETIENKLLIGEKKKNRGNFWFQREDYQAAIRCYRTCIDLIETIEEEKLDQQAIRLLIDCNNNLSYTQIKTDNLSSALETVNKVLALDNKNVKALFRKAMILDMKNELEEGVELLKLAIELEPNNQSIANLLTNLRKRRLIELNEEKKLYQKMINTNKDKHKSNKINLSKNENQLKSITKKFSYNLVAISTVVILIISFYIAHYILN